MSEQPYFKIRFDLLALDGVGTVLFALGTAKMFAGVDFFPAVFQFDETGWVMIVFGVALMLPFLLNFLGQVRERSEGKRFK